MRRTNPPRGIRRSRAHAKRARLNGGNAACAGASMTLHIPSLALAGAWLAGHALWQALSLRRALRLGRPLAARARPFEARPRQRRARVLLLGDSTGVGVGAGAPEHSLGGLLAAALPGLEVHNRCVVGARLADLPSQLAAAAPDDAGYDVALVLVGGNDVLHHTPGPQVAARARALLAALRRRARHVVWIGSADIGSAPVFAAPLAWWFALRCARVARLLRQACEDAGALFVDFADRHGGHPFGSDAGTWFAADGVHPSRASYRYCFDHLMRHTGLRAWLTPPRTTP
jgi:lysophospholipase L1-like esterase